MEISQTAWDKPEQNWWIALTIGLLAAVAFYFSTQPSHEHFDYTFRIASALLRGHVGLQTPAPSWLNEMVPLDGHYYSVFPLGAVLSMVPVALLQEAGLITKFPGRAVAAVLAGLCVYFFFKLSVLEGRSCGRRLFLAFFPIFGTWAWCNLGFAGAWQIALGFALLGEIGALYFTLVRPRPLVAGAFFALAFGNRTELFLLLPIYLYLWVFLDASDRTWPKQLGKLVDRLRRASPNLLWFLSVPLGLAILTAVYNFARFRSVFDFGYSHIPNVFQEPWYQHGVFSVHAIPWNMQKMLFEGFGDQPTFPYLHFFPFGCSIFLASPLLCLLFREGGSFKRVAWVAISLLTFVLWCHGNPGGWQFSYRYAMILIPWMFLLIAGNGPAKISAIELSVFLVSVGINAAATYEFLWTDSISP